LKAEIRQIQDNEQELRAVFEREMTILQSTVTHLEEFKAKLIEDLAESNNKFEYTLNHFNNCSKIEKENYEKNQGSYLKLIEQSHKDTVEELKNKIDKLNSEINDNDAVFER